jgi:hypothetical protein
MDKDKTKRKIIYPIAVYLLVIVLPTVVASILCYFFPEGLVYREVDFYFMGLLLFPLILIPYGWKTQDKRTSALGSIVGWIGYSPLYSLTFIHDIFFTSIGLWLFSFLVPIPGVFVGCAAAERDKTLTAWTVLVYVAVWMLEWFFGAYPWVD